MPLDPQAQALLDKIEESGIPPYETQSPEVARVYYDKACEVARGDPPEPYRVQEITIPGPASELRARCYRASEQPGLPILVFFHGGGYTIGSLDSHDAVCRHLCVEADCLVVSVDYRLGPENKFPAAVEDAYAALCWVARHADELQGDATRLAVGGDSAGGNLSAVTCLNAREAGFPDICFQLLIYPGTDMTESFPSHREFGEGYLLTRSLLYWFRTSYLRDASDRKDWRGSPLHAADHRDLPAAHVITAGYDPLQDEGKAYADKLQAAGVPVTYTHYEGMLHGFITQPGYVDKCLEALRECGARLREAFDR
jgi:acetyl esterase